MDDDHEARETNRVFPEEYSSVNEWKLDYGHVGGGFGHGLFDWWILAFIILGVLHLIAKIIP